MSSDKVTWKAVQSDVSGKVEFEDLPEGVDADIAGYLSEFVTPDSAESWETSGACQWCILKMPEGEHSSLTIYDTLADLLTGLSKLEGIDMSVCVFYGNPIHLTTRCVIDDNHQQRFALLPGKRCVKILPGNTEMLDWDDLPKGAQVQEDGWLGFPLREDYLKVRRN